MHSYRSTLHTIGPISFTPSRRLTNNGEGGWSCRFPLLQLTVASQTSWSVRWTFCNLRLSWPSWRRLYVRSGRHPARRQIANSGVYLARICWCRRRKWPMHRLLSVELASIKQTSLAFHKKMLYFFLVSVKKSPHLVEKTQAVSKYVFVLAEIQCCLQTWGNEFIIDPARSIRLFISWAQKPEERILLYQGGRNYPRI